MILAPPSSAMGAGRTRRRDFGLFMKKTLDFFDHIDNPADAPDFSDPKVLRTMVNDSYSQVAKKMKTANHRGHRFYFMLDFDKPRLKRRIDATLVSYPRLFEVAASVCPSIPEVFSLEEDWAIANATPLPSLDLLEERSYLSSGAAIWILDHIRAAGLIDRAADLLLHNPLLDIDVFMPDIWDSCYDSDLLQNTVAAIQQRNFDCPAAQKKLAKGERPRPFADRDTVASRHHQEVPSRQIFEALLALIPDADKQAAARRCEEKLWEWVRCYYRCRAVYAQRENKLYKSFSRFARQTQNFINEQRQEMARLKSAPAVRQNGRSPLSLLNDLAVATSSSIVHPPALSERLNTKSELVRTVQNLSDEMMNLSGDISDFMFDSVSNVAAAPEHLEAQYGSEIAGIMSGFSIDDPYELCFAVLYLLDNDSDLPWLYFPMCNLMAHAAARLPWGQGSFDVEWDPLWEQPPAADEDGEEDQRYVLRAAPEGARLPEAPDWYRLDYLDKTLEAQEQKRTNLAQLVYRLTGGLVPRDTRRYSGVPGELACFGVTDSESLLAASCIALLSEAQHRGAGNVFAGAEEDLAEEEIEGEEPALTEADAQKTLEQLQETLAALKQENSKLRHAVHSAMREAEIEKKKYDELTEKTQFEHRELAELREIFFYQKNEIEEAPVAGMEYPYTVRRRTVVFGGHDSWARAIKPMLTGDIRFIDRNMLPNADLIRNADNVWLQTNSLSHKFYNKIMDVVRTYEIPLHYFKFASAEKCAEQIALRDAE